MNTLSPNMQRKYLGKLTGSKRAAREAEILYRREHRSNEPFATDVGEQTQRSSYAVAFERLYGRAASNVADVAKLTGVPKKILDEVYARGMAAWQTGHRPGASQHAWALARVYSFVLGGPTAQGPDSDLAAKVRNPTDTFIPPAAVAAEARRALELRASLPPSKRCCTPVGIRRAAQLANRQPVSVDTLRRMKAYFDRHEIDKKGKGWAEGTSKGFGAWLAWGGDSGRKWCEEVLASMGEARHNPQVFSDEGNMAGKTKTTKAKKQNPTWLTTGVLAGGAYVYGRSAKVREKVKGVFDRAHAKLENPQVVSDAGLTRSALKNAPTMTVAALEKAAGQAVVNHNKFLEAGNDYMAKLWYDTWHIYTQELKHRSKAKRNPSAAEHAKRGKYDLESVKHGLQQDFSKLRPLERRGDYASAFAEAELAERELRYAGEEALAREAAMLGERAFDGILKNPGKRLHNFKVLNAKGKAIALTTTLPEANKVCPKGGRVVKL